MRAKMCIVQGCAQDAGEGEYCKGHHPDQWLGVQPLRQKQVQVGGDHYKSMAIQPIEYILGNGIGYAEGNVIKYVSRWRQKNGIEDLRKARHYIDMLIEHETSGGK
jgi:hypothetical protein